jgi:RimJ/RimL family protein N-acetyltransferase
MSKQVFIETNQLLLRQWELEDVLAYATMNADPKVMEHFPSTLSEEESLNHFQKMQVQIHEKGFGLFALELKANGQFIGFTGLSIPSFESAFTPCIEIGWRIASPFWRKGYAFEAASACLSWGFSHLGLSEIFSFTACSNYPSENLMIKLGMQKWGQFEHPKLPEGHHLKTHVVYSTNKSLQHEQ